MERAEVVEQLRGALVVAVDGSPPSAAALRFAADLAEFSRYSAGLPLSR